MASTPDPENPVAGAPYQTTSDETTRAGVDLTEGELELPISGRAVSVVGVSRVVPFLRIDLFGPTISDTDFRLEIEGPLRIVGKDGEWMIDPESGPDAAYLRLVEKTVLRATAFADGSLDVEFTDGERLLVAPHQYEPWQLSGDDGTLVVSVAGGGLAVWEAKPA